MCDEDGYHSEAEATDCCLTKSSISVIYRRKADRRFLKGHDAKKRENKGIIGNRTAGGWKCPLRFTQEQKGGWMVDFKNQVAKKQVEKCYFLYILLRIVYIYIYITLLSCFHNKGSIPKNNDIKFD